MTALARAPIITRYTPPHRGAVDAQAQVWQNGLLGLLQTTANATIFRLPLTFKREPLNPYPANTSEAGVWQNPLTTNFKSKDQFFGAAGMGPAYDWPNPRGYPFPLEGRGFTDSLDLDTLSGALPAKSLLDHPNPRGYPFPLEGRTFLNAVEGQLIGKDKFFAAPGMGPNYDWPNPRIAGRQLPDVGSLAFPIMQGVPFALSDWPNPRGYPTPTENRTFLNAVEAQLIGQDQFFGLAGAPNFDQPNPLAYKQGIDLKTALESLAQTTAFTPAPSQTDWPNPTLAKDRWGTMARALNETWQNGLPLTPTAATIIPAPLITKIEPLSRIVAINAQTWAVVNILPLTSLVQVRPPALSYFGNPSLVPFPLENRTFVNGSEIQLFGQDQFFGAAGQAPANLDWPNPRGYPFPVEMRVSAVENLLTSTLPPTSTTNPFFLLLCTNPSPFPPPWVAVRSQSEVRFVALANPPATTVPFALPDQPNPRGYGYPIENRTFLNAVEAQLIGLDKFFGVGGPSYDWPNPRGYPYPSDLRTFIKSTALGLTAPIFEIGGPDYDYPNPRGYRFPIDLRGFVQGLNPNLKDAFFGLGGPTYDWPNPRGYIFPIELRTWFQNEINAPLPPAAPFYLTDWPNPRGYQFPMIIVPPIGLPIVRFPHVCPGLIWLPSETSVQTWLRSEICLP